MLNTFLKQAKQDCPVFITDVRNAFQNAPGRPFQLHVLLYDGSVRVFPLQVPSAQPGEEEAFIASYLHAHIYNILSSLGAVRMDLYLDTSDAQLLAIAQGLQEVFQVELPKAARTGYGKCLNVNERTLAAITEDGARFCFCCKDIKDAPAAAERTEMPLQEGVFAKLPALAAKQVLLGIDIGGTDIKLSASVNGNLAWCKEYDWFPSVFDHAAPFIEPVVLLVRLMCNAANATLQGITGVDFAAAMSREASLEQIRLCCEAAEAAFTAPRQKFHGIGISFPDVVIRNRIVGGETYKTKGIRDNPNVDYELEFAKITELYRHLLPYVESAERIQITNDGPMAAFTAAVEQAYAGVDVSRGVFAHTLGTELGTGWVKGDGKIPEIPLEVYNFIIDLGSFVQRTYQSEDIRSINNFNTQLPGTLQKYTSQYGAFRLAAKYAPEQCPQLHAEALEKGLICVDGDALRCPTAPKDMRKAYLEFLMEKASAGQPLCQQIFRQIGQFLAVTWEETSYILEPEATDRTLFGRLVKHPACYELICQGAGERTPALRQYAADDTLANTELMQQLAAHPDYTVAQFAQAVGAIYFACL